MPGLDVAGGTLHWEAHGAGPPLVLVHGSGGSALSWWQQVPRYARHHRVITYDVFGFGRSAGDPAARHPRRLAGDLAAVLDAAGVARAALVCQSLGGWTGLPFALAHPERTAALVLSGSPGGLVTPAIARDLAGLPERMARRPGLAGMALAEDYPAREPALTFLYEQIGARNPPDVIAAYGAGLAEVVIPPARLAGFAVPTLLVAGEQDAFFSPPALAEVAAAIPGARITIFPGAGHSPYWEIPAAFDAEILRFLEGVAPWPASS
ncbi:MAG: alpha/beta fold hydrolase [Deltaproteobacteria bacterium]|nr:alpha/beta fold hydrolase [Deltaproteobacteria bacterium]